MTRTLAYIFCLALCWSAAHAQDDASTYTLTPSTETPVTQETPIEAAAQAEEPSGGVSQEVIDIQSAPQGSPTDTMDEPVEPKAPQYEDMPQVELRILDKVRAQSRTYVLNVGRTVAYANIRIRPRACRKSSPLDDPEDASFLQIWEVKPDKSSSWIFSGWMFASSPSLSGMDHPVYDVTVLDCKDPASEAESKSQSETRETTGEAQTDAVSPVADDKAEDPASDEKPVAEEAPEASNESTNETPVDDSAPSSSE